MKIFKVKPNENLIAIFTYINTDEYFLSLQELINFCLDYEYYKELYENFHIIRQLLDEHNKVHTKIRDPKITGVSEEDTIPLVKSDFPTFDDDDLL